MKIEIRKASKISSDFELLFKNDCKMVFKGKFNRNELGFLMVEARLCGELEVLCDISGENFFESIDEILNLKISESVFSGFDEVYDVIEEPSGIFDLYEAGLNEIESIRSGYHRKPEYVDSTSEVFYEDI